MRQWVEAHLRKIQPGNKEEFPCSETIKQFNNLPPGAVVAASLEAFKNRSDDLFEIGQELHQKTSKSLPILRFYGSMNQECSFEQKTTVFLLAFGLHPSTFFI